MIKELEINNFHNKRRVFAPAQDSKADVKRAIQPFMQRRWIKKKQTHYENYFIINPSLGVNYEQVDLIRSE